VLPAGKAIVTVGVPFSVIALGSGKSARPCWRRHLVYFAAWAIWLGVVGVDGVGPVEPQPAARMATLART
jgi:hypothetical protein